MLTEGYLQNMLAIFQTQSVLLGYSSRPAALLAHKTCNLEGNKQDSETPLEKQLSLKNLPLQQLLQQQNSVWDYVLALQEFLVEVQYTSAVTKYKDVNYQSTKENLRLRHLQDVKAVFLLELQRTCLFSSISTPIARICLFSQIWRLDPPATWLRDSSNSKCSKVTKML